MGINGRSREDYRFMGQSQEDSILMRRSIKNSYHTGNDIRPWCYIPYHTMICDHTPVSHTTISCLSDHYVKQSRENPSKSKLKDKRRGERQSEVELICI